MRRRNNLIAYLQIGCTQNIESINCFGYSVYRQGQLVELAYTTDESTGKQSRGAGFHYGRFIQNLRKSASNTKNVTVKEMTVSRLITEDLVGEKVVGVVAAAKDDGKEEKIYAPLTLVADGIFSKFRKEFMDRSTDVMSHFVGFLLHDFELPVTQKGFVCIAKPSPILMYQIAPHDTRVLVDVPGSELPKGNDLKRYMEEMVCPELPPYMQGKFMEAVQTERLRPMPSGFLPPAISQRDGTILLGDALNVRSPLTGGGMTVALWDVITCRELLSRENIPSLTDSDLVIQAMDAFLWKRKRYSAVINVLAMSLYSLFAAQTPEMMVLQNGCFEYFKLGGNHVDGPVDLLSGMNQSPLSLIYHFFMVAFYSIYILFKEGSVTSIPQNICKSVAVFHTACVVIMPYLWGEFKG